METGRLFSAESFFTTGGTMSPTSPSYVERRADKDLYQALKAGKYCYVLDSRQMGKSSLVARAGMRMRTERSASAATVDLQRCGQSVTIEQWYEAQVNQIAEDLGLEDVVEEFWAAHAKAGPLDRWIRTIRHAVLPRVLGPLIIFIDEIDFVRSLPFPTDEFFGGIRGFFNERALDPELYRLVFCLVGVAVPADLIFDEQLTPFNIGQRIDLADFSESETTAGLAGGFSRPSEALLKRVWHWTEGHPFLTQKLAEAVAQEEAAQTTGDVDRICESLYLTAGAREQNDNLRVVASRLLDPRLDQATVLDLYRKVLSGEDIKADRANPFIDALKLSGIVRAVDGKFQVRNRVYRRVFDEAWIRQNLGDREVLRQEEAFARGRGLATKIAAGILVAGLIGWGSYADYKNRTLNAQKLQLEKEVKARDAAERKALTEARDAAAARDVAKAAAAAATQDEIAARKSAEAARLAEGRALAAKQQADLETDKARDAEKRANQATIDAQHSRDDAVNARRAEEADAEKIKEAARQNEELASKLKQQLAISTPLRLAALSETDRSSPDLTAASTLGAIEALKMRWSVDSYSRVLQSLSLLPRDPRGVNWPIALSSTPSLIGPGIWSVRIPSTNTQCFVQLATVKESCASYSGGALTKISTRFAIGSFGQRPALEARYWDIWNAGSFRKLDFKLPPNEFVLSPSGGHFADVDNRGNIFVMEFPSGKQIQRLSEKNPVATEHPSLVQFSPDERYLVTRRQGQRASSPVDDFFGDERETFDIWDLQQGKKIAAYTSASVSATTAVAAMAGGGPFQFSPRGGYFRFSNGDLCELPRTTRNGNESVSTLTPITRTLPGTAEFSADDRYLVVTNVEGSYFYRLPDSRLPAILSPDIAPTPFLGMAGASQIAFSPRGNSVALVVRGRYARVFETNPLQETARVLHGGIISALFNDESTLTTASSTGATTWRVDGHYAENLPQRAVGGASLIAYAPSGQYVVTARGVVPGSAAAPSLHVLDVTASPPKEILNVPGLITDAVNTRFSTKGVILATSVQGKSVISLVSLSDGSGPRVVESASPLVDVSPDGRFLVFLNGEVRDVQGQAVAHLSPGQASLGGLVVSFPDTTTMAWFYGGQLFRATLPQLTPATRVSVPLAGTVTAYSSPDKRNLLLEGVVARGTGRETTFALLDTTQSAPISLFSVEETPNIVGLSRSAKFLFLQFNFPKVHWEIRDLSSGAVVKNGDVGVRLSTSWRFSADERFFAIDHGAQADILDLTGGRRDCKALDSDGRSLVGFDENSRNLLFSRSGQVEFWDVPSCKLVQTAPMVLPALSPDGKLLAGLDRPVIPRQADQLWITDLRDHTSVNLPFVDTITSAAFSESGGVLLVGARDGSVKAYDMARKPAANSQAGPTTLRTPDHGVAVSAVAITPSGQYSASASGQVLRFWDTQTGEIRNPLPAYNTTVGAVAFDRSGKLLAVGLGDGSIEIRGVPGLGVQRKLSLQKPVVALSFSADSKYLAATSASGRPAIWDTEKWTRTADGQDAAQPFSGVFAMSGHAFADYSAGAGSAILEIWNENAWEPVKLDGALTITALALSPIIPDHGQYLLVGTSGGVRIWDTQLGVEVGRIGDALAVRGLALSPDGKSLAVTYSNGTGILTKWQSDDLIRDACDRLGKDQNTMKPADRDRYFLPSEEYKDSCHPSKDKARASILPFGRLRLFR